MKNTAKVLGLAAILALTQGCATISRGIGTGLDYAITKPLQYAEKGTHETVVPFALKWPNKGALGASHIVGYLGLGKWTNTTYVKEDKKKD